MNYNSDDFIEISITSTSKGNQKKWISKEGHLFIKECFYYQDRSWRDDKVEVTASTFAQHCNLRGIEVIKQFPCTIDGRPATLSYNVKHDDDVFVSFYRLITQNDIHVTNYQKQGAEDNFQELVKIFKDTTGLDATRYLLTMAALDAIVGNEDRHYNNFGVYKNLPAGSYTFEPILDFGLGMFEHDLSYLDMPTLKAVQKISGKPFASKSDKVVKWLIAEHKEFLEDFLPRSVNLKWYTFPSGKGRVLFAHRCKEFGIEVIDNA